MLRQPHHHKIMYLVPCLNKVNSLYRCLSSSVSAWSTQSIVLCISAHEESDLVQEVGGAAAGASCSAEPAATSPREHSFHRSLAQASHQAVSCDA